MARADGAVELHEEEPYITVREGAEEVDDIGCFVDAFLGNKKCRRVRAVDQAELRQLGRCVHDVVVAMVVMIWGEGDALMEGFGGG